MTTSRIFVSAAWIGGVTALLSPSPCRRGCGRGLRPALLPRREIADLREPLERDGREEHRCPAPRCASQRREASLSRSRASPSAGPSWTKSARSWRRTFIMLGPVEIRELPADDTHLAYAVMRELRPHVGSESEFVGRVNAVLR